MECKYRLLEPGEPIQAGDENLHDDCETWSEVVPFVCRIPYNPGFFVPIRRPLPPPPVHQEEEK